MKSNLLILIVLTFSICCLSQNVDNKTITEFSQKDKDSISKIIDNLCGVWTCTNEAILNLEKRGIGHYPMRIEKGLILQKISDDPNENIIDQFKNIVDVIFIPIIETQINSLHPVNEDLMPLLKNYYLNCSSEDYNTFYIVKKNLNYGFCCEDDKDVFLPIKFLNDSILELSDGRTYKRVR